MCGLHVSREVSAGWHVSRGERTSSFPVSKCVCMCMQVSKAALVSALCGLDPGSSVFACFSVYQGLSVYLHLVACIKGRVYLHVLVCIKG